jgi:small subunit ribosomal protein S16
VITIRLTRAGKRNRPFYRVIAIDHRARRDGRPLEMLGTYDPVSQPSVIRLESERIEAWQKNGAQLSPAVRSLVRRARKQAPETSSAAAPSSEAAATPAEA